MAPTQIKLTINNHLVTIVFPQRLLNSFVFYVQMFMLSTKIPDAWSTRLGILTSSLVQANAGSALVGSYLKRMMNGARVSSWLQPMKLFFLEVT